MVWQQRSSWLGRALLQVHLWSGLSLSLYILVICVSGSAIVFRRELDKALCPTTVTVPVRSRRLTPAELEARVQSAYPRFDQKEIEIRGANAPNAPVEVRLSGNGLRLERLFDPYTGANLADTVACEPRFITALAAFHGDLAGGRAGRRINGLGALAVTLICITGLIVWWPGKAHWWRAVTFRRNVTWRRLVRDLHSALGFWLLLSILMWAFTGIYFAFPEPFNALEEMLTDAGVSSLTIDDTIAGIVRLHFGRTFGYTVEALWAIIGLLPMALVLTGVIMWWHRSRTRRHPSKDPISRRP